MPKNPDSTHPLSRLLDEFRRAASSDLQAALADRSRVAAARARVQELVEDGRRREKARREAQEAYAAGTGELADLESALRAERDHEELVRCAREGAEQVSRTGSGAEARLERARRDFVERAAPMYREALESKLAELADTLRGDVEDFLRPVEEADEPLARALAQTLPGMAAVVGRVESALRDAEGADARRSGPREYHPGGDGAEEPLRDRPSPAEVLQRAAEERGRVDASSAGRPVGVTAGRIMQ